MEQQVYVDENNERSIVVFVGHGRVMRCTHGGQTCRRPDTCEPVTPLLPPDTPQVDTHHSINHSEFYFHTENAICIPFSYWKFKLINASARTWWRIMLLNTTRTIVAEHEITLSRFVWCNFEINHGGLIWILIF